MKFSWKLFFPIPYILLSQWPLTERRGGGGSISFPYKGISNERPKKVKDGLNNSVLRSERRAPGWFMTKNEFRPPQSPYIKKWLVTSAIKSASTSLSLSLTLSLFHALSLTHSHSLTLTHTHSLSSSSSSHLEILFYARHKKGPFTGQVHQRHFPLQDS